MSQVSNLSQTDALNWRLVLVLSVAGFVGVAALIPSALTLQAPNLRDLPIPLWLLLPIQLALNGVFISLVVAGGVWLGKRTGLGAPLVEGWLAGKKIARGMRAIFFPTFILGVFSAVIVLALEIAVFAPRMPLPIRALPRLALWQTLLASMYGGITEELFVHLGLFSLVAWTLARIVRAPLGLPPQGVLWATNILVAALFALGHLPATASLFPLTTVIVVRAVVLNGMLGVVFGYLYWSRGLESAMLAHFAVDVILHAVAPLVEL